MRHDWPVVPLGALLTDVQPGFASGKHNSEGSGLPHLRPMNVSTGGAIDRSTMKYVDPGLADKPERRLKAGDVLFNNTNSPELVGKTAVFQDDDEPAFSNHMTRIRCDSARLDARYLASRLHHAWREGWFAAHCNNHVSQASIGRDVLKSFPIELPPVEVQRAIADTLEQASTLAVSASSHLAKAQQQLQAARRAVLAAACVGRLTADWREAHPDTLSLEDALAQLQPKTRRRTRETQVELSLPELPATFTLATLGDVAEILEYGTSKRCDATRDTGVPVLRMANIQGGQLDLSNLKYCERDEELDRLMLDQGDLLFNRTNSPELVGKSAVFAADEPMSFASYLIRVRFMAEFALPEFVNYWLNSAWGREWAQLVKTDGVSQSNINGTKLALMPLPLPPLEEQRVIVERASTALAAAERTHHRAAAGERMVESARQAVFAKAFRGELVNAESP